MRSQGVHVDINKQLLKEDIVKRFSLRQMSVILGRSNNYLAVALSTARSNKLSILMADLEKICMILGEEPYKYIEAENAKAPQEMKTEAQQERKPEAPDMTKLYEGVELNGQALGKLIEAVKEQTDAIKEQTEEIKKLATDMTNWSKKWCNQQRYGRF